MMNFYVDLNDIDDIKFFVRQAENIHVTLL